MQVPLEWSHRGFAPERASGIEALVRQQASKLERHAPDIVACRVAVEQPQSAPSHGSPFRVRIEVTIPGSINLVISREPGHGDAHEDVETAVRQAFTSMDRQIEEARAKRRGDVKTHNRDTSP